MNDEEYLEYLITQFEDENGKIEDLIFMNDKAIRRIKFDNEA